MTTPHTEHRKISLGLKSALDIGPLLIFFFTYFIADKLTDATLAAGAPMALMWATGAFMIATFASIAVTYALERRVALMPLISAGVVLVFGGLTLYLRDERFIKLKPTIIYSSFAVILFGGLLFKRLFVRHLLGTVMQLSEAGWRAMTIRWGLFFVLAAILNEIVWRNFSTDVWVTFKVWGFMALTIAFAVWQGALMTRYQLPAQPSNDGPGQSAGGASERGTLSDKVKIGADSGAP